MVTNHNPDGLYPSMPQGAEIALPALPVGLVLDQDAATSDRSSWRLAAAAPDAAAMGALESAGASNSAVYRRL